MIEISEFGYKLLDLQQRYPNFDEQVIRLHLMGYSVIPQILKTKWYWSLYKYIEGGYFGLLRTDFLLELLRLDPFDVNDFTAADSVRLQQLVLFQVEDFRKTLGSRRKDFQYDSYEHLLNDLSVLDRDAVMPQDEFNRSLKSEGDPDPKSWLESYWNKLIVSVGDQKFVIDHQSFKDDSYQKYVDFFITEFYVFDTVLRTDSIYQEIVDAIPSDQHRSGVYCPLSGVGAFFLAYQKKFPGFGFDGVRVETRNVCESFLCHINLWTMAKELCEPLVSYSADPIEDLRELINGDSLITPPDLVVAVVSEYDRIGYESPLRQLFKLSFESEFAEDKWLELLHSIVTDNGSIYIALPTRFLASVEGRTSREYYLSQIKQVIEIEPSDPDSKLGRMAIVNLELSNESNEQTVVKFQSKDGVAEVTQEDIRKDNELLDLSPGRFLNSVEYRFRDVLRIFDDVRMGKAHRQGLLEILGKLEHSTVVSTDFVQIRNIIETVVETVRRNNPRRLPDRLFNLREGRLTACTLYLSGERDFREPPRWKGKPSTLFPRPISDSLKLCIGLGNKGAHGNADGLSIYAYRAATFALLNVLDWMKTNFDNI